MQRLFLLPVIFTILLVSCKPGSPAQIPPPSTQEIIPSIDPAAVPHDPPATCAVTQPQDPVFVPPAPYLSNGPSGGEFWYGSDSLWTALPVSGSWWGLPHNPEGYSQKNFGGEKDIRLKLSLSQNYPSLANAWTRLR